VSQVNRLDVDLSKIERAAHSTDFIEPKIAE